MLFHTWTFALFFLVFYSVYLSVRRTRLGIPWLLVSSYCFYGWWNPLYLLLIFYSTWIDYWVVGRMDQSPRRRLWLTISLVNNLGILVLFKYAGFATANINLALESLGTGYRIPEPDMLLPVGISFFTFQSMSYTIDFYRGQVERETSLVRFATFVSLFPQLVAGPIERAKTLLPQFTRLQPITWSRVADGVSVFVVGLFKKVACANALALYVDSVYNVPENHTAPALILATVCFAWQIYFDFSGYTDMARGLARMMGFDLSLNFNHPYLATGLGDFWRRWHISLSSWFRDYVYIPLGGSRGGAVLTYWNMALTLLISGIWHGAAWTFVAWGAFHAIARVLTRGMESSTWYRERTPAILKRAWVFGLVCLSWVFFRAMSWEDAVTIFRGIFSPVSTWTAPEFPISFGVLIALVWSHQWFEESRFRRILERPVVRFSTMVLLLSYLWIFCGASEEAFIYFQF